MSRTDDPVSVSSASRRRFLKTSSATILAGVSSLNELVSRNAYAAGSDLLRVGLIGCGDRGTGAAAEALNADPNVKLMAMGDAFADRLQSSLAKLKANPKVQSKVDVREDRCYTGFDAYQKVIDSGVDVVLLAEPPHFRPKHLKAAVAAGKHVFAEKPVAVDGPGVRSVLETCEAARQKKLSVVSGLCLRHSRGFQESVQRIQDGSLGEVRALLANDYRGSIWVKPRQPKWTDMEWQMRNWYYFTWLSGDFNVEQHVHFLDICAWVMKGEYPVRAVGTGGRQVRVGPEYGNIYDHHSVIYEYANGTRLFSNCRQQPGCLSDMSCDVLAANGTAHLAEDGLVLKGGTTWKYSGPDNDIYQTEHDVFFAAIRSGKPVNDGEYMAKSTLLAIMGRMATYTGQAITWEQAMNSKEDLSPGKYEWGPIPTPSVAMPGITQYI